MTSLFHFQDMPFGFLYGIVLNLGAYIKKAVTTASVITAFFRTQGRDRTGMGRPTGV